MAETNFGMQFGNMDEMGFDDLVAASQTASNKNAEHEIWRRAMNLPHWFFIAAGDPNDPEPMAAKVDGRPHLIAFTDEDRAEAFAKRTAEKLGVQPSPVLHMEVPDAIGYCQILFELGVEGLHMNDGGFAFDAPLGQVIDMHKRYAT